MTSVSPDLTGEIALITGCAGLLGPVHADALIRCGTFVVVTDIDEERARETAHRLADEHGLFAPGIEVSRSVGREKKPLRRNSPRRCFV